jgi:hypothetical protein
MFAVHLPRAKMFSLSSNHAQFTDSKITLSGMLKPELAAKTSA